MSTLETEKKQKVEKRKPVKENDIADLKYIEISKNGEVMIEVKCLSCGKKNLHNITRAATKDTTGTIKLEFSKFGTRSCDGTLAKPCKADYKLY